ncbi:12752_t:CDS:2 [Entrophospora sp. SA101]|nr:12037_t:CDS:2 [Entrophospora sp. SA101]CAJ0875496.1 12752_t:CDS:2 [Entrophospora sp. SA101]
MSNPLPQPPPHRYGQSSRSEKINKPAPIIVSGDIKIVDLRPWVRGFDIKCILLELISKRTLKTNSDVEIHSFLVADETATCTLVIWDKGQHFREGDVVQIYNGDAMQYKESEEPNMSGFLWISENNGNKESMQISSSMSSNSKSIIYSKGTPKIKQENDKEQQQLFRKGATRRDSWSTSDIRDHGDYEIGNNGCRISDKKIGGSGENNNNRYSGGGDLDRPEEGELVDFSTFSPGYNNSNTTPPRKQPKY